MIIEMVPQRSAEWHAMKLGTISASSANDIDTAPKRKTFVFGLLAQILTGKSNPFYVTDAVQRGIDMEQFAKEDYEKLKGTKIEDVGFIFQDEERIVGCSPDGLVRDEGLIEIKCPNTATHISYIVNGPPKAYVLQMQFQMYITGRKWCDFVSWDDRVDDENLVMYTKRIYRDNEMISAIDRDVKLVVKDVKAFLTEHNQTWRRF